MKSIGTTAALVTMIALGWPAAASAQDRPPAESAPQYPAPLSQQTQPSYIPQSVALSGPRVILDWEAGDSIPPGYHRSTRVRKGPVIGGAILFGIFYLFSTLGAAVGADAHPNETNPEAALWVPAVGPFIQMANTSTTAGNWMLGVDGLAQSAGLALLIYGLSSPREVLVRNDLGLRIVPRPMLLVRGGGGLGLSGTF